MAAWSSWIFSEPASCSPACARADSSSDSSRSLTVVAEASWSLRSFNSDWVVSSEEFAAINSSLLLALSRSSFSFRDWPCASSSSTFSLLIDEVRSDFSLAADSSSARRSSDLFCFFSFSRSAESLVSWWLSWSFSLRVVLTSFRSLSSSPDKPVFFSAVNSNSLDLETSRSLCSLSVLISVLARSSEFSKATSFCRSCRRSFSSWPVSGLASLVSGEKARLDTGEAGEVSEDVNWLTPVGLSCFPLALPLDFDSSSSLPLSAAAPNAAAPATAADPIAAAVPTWLFSCF